MRNVLRCVALLSLLVAAPVAAQDVGLALGTTPEAVTIQDLAGNDVELAKYIGKKPVLIEFWATWCPLCAALEPKLSAAKRQHGDRLEVLFVAVGVNQTPRSITRHLEAHAMPGPVLYDGRGRAVRAFMAPSTSYIVGLDANGRVVYTGSGDDQNIPAAVAKVMGPSR
jgi:thiol-disulfide isomerase/thioredoxin